MMPGAPGLPTPENNTSGTRGTAGNPGRECIWRIGIIESLGITDLQLNLHTC